MESVSIKRKLRELKRLEIKTRYGNSSLKQPSLVWDAFFDLQDKGTSSAKYPLRDLVLMSRDEFKKVIGEYWSFVYQAFFQENDFHSVTYDTGILLSWGLPYDADEAAVKKRFRELAKLSHPDTGGNADAFIAMMEEYKKLTGK